MKVRNTYAVTNVGTVCSRGESVHGHALTPDEVPVCVSSVFVDQPVVSDS